MISAHCGEPLARVYSFARGRQLGVHKWKCQKCPRTFTQKIRQPTAKRGVVDDDDTQHAS